MAEDDAPTPEIPDEEDVLKVLNHLCELYLEDNNLTAEHRPYLSLPPFLRWVRQKFDEGTLTGAGLAAELQCDETAASYVLNLTYDPGASEQLRAGWPHITLKDRPEYALHSISILTLMRYDDGTLCPVTHQAHKDLTDQPLNDKHVAQVCMGVGDALAGRILTNSLRGLHEHQRDQGQVQVDAQVLNAFRQALDIGLDKMVEDQEVDQGTSTQVRQVGEFFAKLMDEPEQEVKDQVAAQREAAQLQGGNPSEQPQGGWSG